MTEMWELIHALYGDELGLTSDDEDYIPPLTSSDELQIPLHPSMESFSEVNFLYLHYSIKKFITKIGRLMLYFI